MSKFKVGDKVVRVSGYYLGMNIGDVDTISEIVDDDVNLERYGKSHSPDSLELVTAWDYAEADRLEQAAKDAIKAYNEYVQRQPKRVYLPMYLPD